MVFFALDNEARFIYVNKAAVTFLNKRKEQLLGFKCNEVMEELLTEEIYDYYEIVKITREPVKFELYSELLQATFGVRIYPMNDLISVYFLDITEQKKMEEWMKKTEKLSLVGQLAAGVAHEIRNPMTSIKGFIQLTKSTKECKETYIDIILAELERTEAIIYEFLALAKPNEPGILEKTSMIDLLEKVVTFFEAQAFIRGVTIETKYIRDSVIQCNTNQIKQVFINIIQNAIEACDCNGKIVISLKEKESQHVVIEVEDNGCGIPVERLQRLGEPFYSTKEKGTGLGLLVTYKIIEAHKGKLNFKSEQGRGTTVEIELPKRIVSVIKDEKVAQH